MAKYRKKPIEIEAWRVAMLHYWAGAEWGKMPRQIEAAYDRGDILFLNHPPRIEIKTLEGTMTADVDDMVICGVKGELYPCKPDIFAETYEMVE